MVLGIGDRSRWRCRSARRSRSIGWLYRVFPPLSMIRGVVRFGEIVLAAVAILAGFGLAAC